MTKEITSRQAMSHPTVVATINVLSETTQRLQDEIDELKAALTQPEQEPVVWMYQDKSTHQVSFQKHMKVFVDHSNTSEVPLYGKPLANHELQCVCGAVWCGDEMVHLPNKTPPKRPWVGLTGQEKALVASVSLDVHDAVHRTETKLKEKNT